MDNITHTLFGWTLSRTGIGRATPYAAATLIIASNAPDADIVTAFTGGGLEYLAAHRGPTHGPLGFVGLGVATAVLVFLYARWRAWRRGERLVEPAALFGRLCLLGLLGVTMHALMDLPTSYGTRLLSPFVTTWYAFDWMPIIDIYLLALLAGGLVAARLRRGARAQIAAAVLVLVGADYAARAVLHQRALGDAAARKADGTPAPCVSRPTLVRYPASIDDTPASAGGCLLAAALPTFISPFEFRIVRQHVDGYELSERNVLDGASPVAAFWLPVETGPAISHARATRTGQVFLDFSRFPSAHAVEQASGEVVVQFVDVRFMGTPFRLGPNPQARVPSGMTVRLDANGRVVREYLGN